MSVDTHPVRAGIGQVLGSSRPLSWINTAYPFAAAYLLAGGDDTVVLVVGIVYFLVPYNLLMYGINDVFDHESDLRNPRKGGVEGIVLDDRWHRTTLWAAVLSNLPFLALLAWWGSGWSDLVLAVSVFAVIAYSAPHLRLKERPVVDSLTSSTHFVSPAVFAVTLAGGSFTRPALAVLTAYFLWGSASHAFGAVQDITADRGAGIASIATVFGARRTVRLAMLGYAAAAVLMLAAGWPGRLAALVPLAYLASVAPFRDLTDAECELANRGWRRFLWLNLVMGFLVTQLLIVMALTTP
ncbi:MAG: prenyltransferase [Brevundimonas sp.]